MSRQLQCMVLGLVGVISAPGMAQPVNLIVNGSFENPTVFGQFYDRWTYPASFGGWTVGTGSVDVVKTWQDADGNQSVDLGGNVTGSVYQDVDTEPGRFYRLSFSLAGNPDRTFGEPAVKQVRVEWGGQDVGTFAFDTSNTSGSDMQYRVEEVCVTAIGEFTRLEFVNVVGDETGAVIDDVKLQSSVSITEDPQDADVCLNATAEFHALGQGTAPLSYVWRRNAIVIDQTVNPSAVTDRLVISAATASDAGVYDCIVTDSCSSAQTRGAELRICLANINCDSEVDFGDFLAFFNCYDAETPCADIDASPGVDFGDFLSFFNAYDAGC